MEQDLLNNLKWKELAEIEAYMELPMDEWATSQSKAKLAFIMQYMMAKRTNTGLTIEAAQEMSITELTQLAGMDFASPKEENPA